MTGESDQRRFRVCESGVFSARAAGSNEKITKKGQAGAAGAGFVKNNQKFFAILVPNPCRQARKKKI